MKWDKDKPLDDIKWEIISTIRFMCMQVWKPKNWILVVSHVRGQRSKFKIYVQQR
jgi:hypothetical protein